MSRDVPEVPLPDAPTGVRAFTAAQRRALVIVLLIFIACLIVALIRKPASILDPMPDKSARFDELVDQIDPNVADAETLSALPQLGPKRAKDIVEYRERIRAGDASRVVFKKLDDLMRVRGIGAAMTEHLNPFLKFPTTAPTTESSR